MPSGRDYRTLFWGIGVAVVVVDFITKQIAQNTLSRIPVHIVGDWLLFRLVYNPGAAFGIHVGEHSRWVFTTLAIIALIVLGAMAQRTAPSQWFRLTGLGLVCGGAVGNLVDRVSSNKGVVDFIDVWIGPFHWPTFNVADIAVTCGALALAVAFWHEGKQPETAPPEDPESSRRADRPDTAEA